MPPRAPLIFAVTVGFVSAVFVSIVVATARSNHYAPLWLLRMALAAAILLIFVAQGWIGPKRLRQQMRLYQTSVWGLPSRSKLRSSTSSITEPTRQVRLYRVIWIVSAVLGGLFAILIFLMAVIKDE